jgi:hypothetical protein
MKLVLILWDRFQGDSNMNWGWKIVVLYSGFVIMTLAMVFYFMGHEVDLVAKDYYKQEIEYQDQIDKINNTKSLKESIGFEYSEVQGTVKINFPNEHLNKGLNGKIHFFRPSDSGLDKIFDINPSENGEQVIAIGNLTKGLWKIKISWSADKKDYYDEKIITI